MKRNVPPVALLCLALMLVSMPLCAADDQMARLCACAPILTSRPQAIMPSYLCPKAVSTSFTSGAARCRSSMMMPTKPSRLSMFVSAKLLSFVAAVLAVGGLPLGLLAGHYIGRRADKEVTIIRIIPE